MTDPARELAGFVQDVEYRSLTSEVKDRLGLVLADTVGGMVGGTQLSDVASLAEHESDSNPGDASILGTGLSAASSHAAMVNATGATALDIDEGNRHANGHPAIHVIPAVLAVAETTNGSIEPTLSAIVAGYEVATRVGRACYPLDETYHMHGLWGTVGTAAGVARYRELSVDQTAHAIRMAANHALHTRFESGVEGATVRNTYAGTSNLLGMMVADQAAIGYTGMENGIERHLRRVSDAFDAADLTDGLRDLWEISRGYFKRHAACRSTHPTLDALERLNEAADVDPSAIDVIRVETHETATRLQPTRPTNTLQAKFSLPFAAASYLYHGHAHTDAFIEAALREEIYELSERISIESDDELAGSSPAHSGARVAITMENGETFEAAVEEPTAVVASDEVGVTDAADATIRGKYDWLVEPTLGPSRTQKLWTAARTPETTTPTELCRLATPE
jgi:2-methylcitrate dehydratase PrpD